MVATGSHISQLPPLGGPKCLNAPAEPGQLVDQDRIELSDAPKMPPCLRTRHPARSQIALTGLVCEEAVPVVPEKLLAGRWATVASKSAETLNQHQIADFLIDLRIKE